MRGLQKYYVMRHLGGRDLKLLKHRHMIFERTLIFIRGYP